MPANEASVRYREEHLPPHDASHGTPHAMIRRSLEFELPGGSALLEQTDYGHPGRWNPWEPRQVAANVQPRTALLLAAAEAISSLVDAGEG
ncbi:MAG: hypothetical protein WD939_07490 [Dehalococcoidia bacterium]